MNNNENSNNNSNNGGGSAKCIASGTAGGAAGGGGNVGIGKGRGRNGGSGKPKKYNSSNSVIDRNGFRLNVGMIITNAKGQVFWGKRYYGLGWQFPQGGMAPRESIEEAMFRELEEETGLRRDQVDILAMTSSWYFYALPGYLRKKSRGRCIGQRQRWFLLRLKDDAQKIDVRSVPHPEFSDWRWIDYWAPIQEVIFFKRRVYERALKALAPYNVVDVLPD